MMSDGYSTSKKSDDICEDVCGGENPNSPMSMSRLRCCILHGLLDMRTILFLFIIVPTGIIGGYFHGQKVTYFFRPLWQKAPDPFVEITHYYHENITMENLCKLHGWGIREYPRRVFDAVLFNNEVDMLTIRWKELYPYITQFVLLESNSTFTSLPKPHFFAASREKFKFVEPRLTYGTIGGRFQKGENPFIEEAYQRIALDRLLGIAGIEDDDLLIMSDVDEIPSSHTINLLRWCDEIPEVLHLQLRNYLYSFEFYSDSKSWRASVHRYKKGKTRYAHFRRTDYLLSDAGWHCSFCFRHISDFIFKMKAYSHTDRVRFSHYLDPKRIQDIICRGADLYDMLPEEYTFKEIIGRMGPIPHSYSGVYLPSYLLDNADKYKYLLPGNCRREDR
ncbi:OLC1v1011277C1 [Oldenlandia corymbosa var. corymbosa]|uniref:OLC1v1011277C1 n=1 Tax=Oldenlandia corymbosa var. corymbosa TaxID=529605 RepID=A0AAV1DT90_OLDCO|nr:OLC1v1011277C1 [Oldenlandia corymbosa var. corymbosa]